MDLGRGKVTPRNGVVVGSVWESRMKVDEVKGGIKVFNAEENPQENSSSSSSNNNEIQVYKRTRPKQGLTGGVSGKRKTWKPETSQGFERNPIQIAKQKSESNKNLDEQCKELSVSADGIKKTPTQIAKQKSELKKNLDELSVSADGIKKSPIHKLRTRSVSQKGSSESSNGIEKNSITLRKVKSESNKGSDESSDGIGIDGKAELRKVKSEGNKDGRNSISSQIMENPNVLVGGTERESVELRKEKYESNEVVEGSMEEIEKNPIGTEENWEEIGVCEEKVITSHLANVGQVKSPPELELTDDDKDGVDDEEDWDEEVDEEIVIEEIKIAQNKPKKVVIEERKILPNNGKPLPISPIVRKQQPPVVNHLKIIPKPQKTKSTPVSDGVQRVPKTHNKWQSLADLVMWRDASKSTFVFGIGTFIIISSSYTRDLNISLISVVSYVGLVYLATIFLFRSIVCRGAIDIDDTNQDHVVGEEEAVWLVKLILPYVNEFLLKLRALFSGDPATTMKLAVLLFVLARCGSSITVWKMAKLGFFGVFLVPKVCSSYSTQLTAYGTFWIRRFRDAWESCSHKKGVALATFTLVWNFSSVVARIWAVFMLFVGFRYYQHSLMREEWVVEEEEEEEDSWQGQIGGHRQRNGPTSVEINKQKKRS